MKSKFGIVLGLLMLFTISNKASDDLYTALESGIDIVVDATGSGDYTTVQKAIDAVPNNSSSRFIIFIKNGRYYEKVRISSTKKNLVLIGENVDSTIIVFDDYASVSGFDCTTVKVDANDFLAMNITFENSFDNTPERSQALAMATYGDRQVFAHCKFLGYQDTYFSGSEYRAYFKDCLITGAVDFIYGPTTILFDSCQIHNVRSGGYITAASTPEGNKFGYVFRNCWISSDIGVTGVFFGRPWRPYCNVVFMNCYESACISPLGWHNWGNPDNELTTFYAEYNCYGPGSDTTKREEWGYNLTDEQAAGYTHANIFSKSNNPSTFSSSWMPTLENDTLYSVIKEHTLKFLDPGNLNARLNSLKSDGIDVEGFHPDSSLIVIEYPSGTIDIPLIEATSANPLNVIDISYPDTIPGFVTIDVTTQYLASFASYDLYLSVDGAFHSADIVQIKMNTMEIPNFDPEVTTYDFVVSEGTSRYMPMEITLKVDGARKKTIRPESLPGTYEFHVTAVDGITTKIYYVNVSFPTSIENKIHDFELNIENPINNKLKGFLKVPVDGNYSIEIYSLSGIKLLTQTLGYLNSVGQNFTIDTEMLPQGMLFYKIMGESISISGELIK